MAKKYEPKSIEEIISSTEYPKAPLTKAERAVIARENKKRIDEQHRRIVDDFVDNFLKPWLAVLDQARALRTPENADLFAQLTEQMRKRAAHNPVLRRKTPEIPRPGRRALFGSACNDSWSHGPPYLKGNPDNEITTDTVPPSGLWKASSALAIGDEGILSVGLGVGRFWITDLIYPASQQVFVWATNQIVASIIHLEEFQTGPLAGPQHVDVNVHVTIEGGPSSDPSAHTLFDGGGVGGPNFALGTMHFILWGFPTAFPGCPVATCDYKRFLRHGWDDFYLITDYDNEFDLSASAILGSGATGVGVFVAVRLTAGVRGTVDDVMAGLTGFAGVDLRDPYKSQAIWPFEPGGGPIRVSNMDFCLRPFFPDSVILPKYELSL